MTGGIFVDAEFFKACGFQNPIVYNLRDKTDNHILHRALAIGSIPAGLIKYMLRLEERWEKGIAIVAIAKNEGAYLAEWIEFYKTQGIDNIILYDNDSTDDTKEIISHYVQAGFVLYHTIRGKMRQYDAYHRAIDQYKYRFKYLAFIDCDEFLFCKDLSIFDYIDKMLNCSKIGGGHSR